MPGTYLKTSFYVLAIACLSCQTGNASLIREEEEIDHIQKYFRSAFGAIIDYIPPTESEPQKKQKTFSQFRKENEQEQEIERLLNTLQKQKEDIASLNEAQEKLLESVKLSDQKAEKKKEKYKKTKEERQQELLRSREETQRQADLQQQLRREVQEKDNRL